MKELIDKIEADMKLLDLEIAKIKKKNVNLIEQVELAKNCDKDLLTDFFEEFWITYPSEKDGEWFVAVPKFMPFSVGWLSHTTKGYNIFQINKYTNWLGEVPLSLRKELQIKEPEKIFVSDDNLIFDEGKEQEVMDKYGEKLSSVSKGTAKIKRGKEFDLIAQIIENGSLPFIPKPVEPQDIREYEGAIDFKGKFDFQKKAWEQFLKVGALGVYWMTGAGKDIFSTYLLSRIKVKELPNLYVSPNLSILEQMKQEYFPKYAPQLINEIENGKLVMATYQSYDKLKDKEYGLVIFGECHVLPADSFSRLSTLKCKYRLGQCLHPKTNITLESGNTIELRQLIKKLKEGQKINVLTYNENKRTVESKPILNFYEKEMKDLLRISIKTKKGIKKIVCSPDHKFYIHGTYIPALQLKIGNKVTIANQPHLTLNNPAKMPEIRVKISQKLTGKKVPFETKEKLRKITQKKWKIEGYREHQSLVHKGQKSYLKGRNMEEYFGKEKANLIKQKIGIKSKEAINNQFKELMILKKDFERKGFRFIPLVKVIPDAIAIKDNKIFAIELEHKIPRYEKYDGTQGFDDVIWIIKKGRRNTLC